MGTLEDRQLWRERGQLEDGIRKYHEEFNARGAGESKAGLGVVFVAMREIIPWIEENVALLEDGKAHPSQVPLSVHWLCEMQPEAVAYITAKLCVSASYNRANVTRTAMNIANLLEENVRFEELEQAEPALANSMARRAKRWNRSSTRRKIMRKAADIAGVKRMGWTEVEKLKLGVKLMEVYVEETGFAQLALTSEGDKNTHRVIDMTDDVKARLAERHERLAIEVPGNKPMLCPPRPWTNPVTGGYLSPDLKTTILRGTSFRKVTEGLVDELFSTDMPEVYAAVNAVQATAWRINKPLFEVMQAAWLDDAELDDALPPADDLPLPPVPAIVPANTSRDNMTDEERAALDGWKQEARAVHEANAMNRSKRGALLSKLSLSREVVDEEAIYFPHSLDFRGRIYPMSAELSPQSDDISKALLMFAEGKPLGDSGGYWLAVHIANLFGHDKVPFDERVAWTQDNQERIKDSALRPLDGEKFWTTADEPWCALAACFEWVDSTYGMDENYPSCLPIAMDGTCSGIQHYSAMLRDQRGAEAVNLTNNETPADIYTEVLHEVKVLLNHSSEPLAKVWHDKVDRKIVKRPCMTFAYSVTSAGIRNQILDEIRKRQDGDYLPGTPDWEAAAFLAPLVEQAIRGVVDRAAEAMDWLKGVSKIISKQDIPTGWTTPLGFRVLQPYLKSKGQRIKLWFQGVEMKLQLTFEGDKIDGAKQQSAVAPNYVHSLDACHLMMTVNRMVDITDSFAVIHDSFGVHACDVDELHYALRDEFINLYSDEVLVNFYQESLLRIPGEEWPNVPSPPEAGDYNLEEVRDADFFFA